ncbi:hypothetical protein CDL12_21156 [Handroanthus impetiginosus]|uniref:Uncharacterized protein n=1 Tax=Handroanthus impetiginosus TaxID=429701 RepID=A0A2G9GLV4_9LAMI|nr:hypothetical protein CDL12_21156 [Handroanthus impetiginosus]
MEKFLANIFPFLNPILKFPNLCFLCSFENNDTPHWHLTLISFWFWGFLIFLLTIWASIILPFF